MNTEQKLEKATSTKAEFSSQISISINLYDKIKYPINAPKYPLEGIFV